ncbi:MAG: Asp-tRNA(Asn)/Glu-tRNA(Gln) amidotransferase subunit GatC [Candidatus Paceibacterota bacterium]
MNIDDITKLSELARIDLDAEEKTALLEDFKSILAYVDQIQSVETGDVDIKYDDENTFREDEVVSADAETIKIIKESFPDQEDGFLKVNTVLRNDD